MIVNGQRLLDLEPVYPMEHYKQIHTSKNGTLMSYGLTECGYDIRLAEDVWLFWGRRFVLASSMECFDMPPFLMGTVMNKSSWARKGIDASKTTNIEPGWRGFLTIELTYHKMKPIKLEKGTGIAQVIFHEIHEPRLYVGKYQDQSSGPQKAR